MIIILLSQRRDIIMLDKIALTLVVIGAVNWGSIGLFGFDIVGFLFGGMSSIISRIIFTIVGLAGLWCISILFKRIESTDMLTDTDN